MMDQVCALTLIAILPVLKKEISIFGNKIMLASKLLCKLNELEKSMGAQLN
jgi:hypothetical protein